MTNCSLMVFEIFSFKTIYNQVNITEIQLSKIFLIWKSIRLKMGRIQFRLKKDDIYIEFKFNETLIFFFKEHAHKVGQTKK